MLEQDFFSQFKIPDDQFYDYDAALKADAKPDASGHWPSDFKKPGHPNEIVGGFNTRTGLPEKGHTLITNPDELVKLGWEPKTALELSRKYSNEQPDDFFSQFNEHTPDKPNIQAVNENEPDTWMKGFINSVTSGDALSGTGDSLMGYAKGIPKGIWGGLKSAGNLALASSGPLGELITGKSAGDRGKEFIDTVANIPNVVRGMANTTMQSGSNPEAFGELMGELTGAPLVTHGLIKGAPMATRLSGYPVELLGKGVKRYPLSGWVPFARTAIPNIRRLDRSLVSGPIGQGIESVGKMMKRVGINEQVTSENMPTIVDGEDLTPKNYKVIRDESTPVNKPKFRTNGDGTFTNLDTGEVLDSKGQSIVEINNKPIDSKKNLHNIQDLEKIAKQQGNVNLYHGTTGENAKSILNEEIKLPKSGEEAARFIAQKYNIPWMEWKTYVEPYNIGSAYGEATKKLSTAPIPVAERWSNNFPQGEIFSDLNTKARMWNAAKKQGRTKDFDNFYEEIANKQEAAGGSRSIYDMPDYAGIGSDNLMPKSNIPGEILSITVDARSIPKYIRIEAERLLEQIKKGKMTEEEALQSWNNNYKDIKIAPQNIKTINGKTLDMNKTLDKNSPFFTRNRRP